MDELLARLEKATGPDHKLDQEIFAYDRGWSYPLFGAAWGEWSEGLREGLQLHYTSSLDAALTLVPEGRRPALIQRTDMFWECALLQGMQAHFFNDSCHTSAPIALCIAALKARAAHSNHG